MIRAEDQRNDMTVDAREKVDQELATMRSEGLAILGASGTLSIHREMLQAGGKLLRPRLVLLCAAHGAELGGSPDWPGARRAALAIHLGHTGSLYHDDIVDRSATRRSVPAIHRATNVRVSSLAGAQLMALCNSLISRLPSRLRRHWARTAQRMADGQLRDSESVGCLTRDSAQIVDVASRKTGAAFEMATHFGSFLGGATPSDRSILTTFGHHLGIAFQLANDLEDFVHRPNTHRPAANDLRERLYSVAVVIGCAREDEFGARLRAILEDDGRPLSDDATEEAVRILWECGALDDARKGAVAERELARDVLADLPLTSARCALEEFISDFAIPETLEPHASRHAAGVGA